MEHMWEYPCVFLFNPLPDTHSISLLVPVLGPGSSSETESNSKVFSRILYVQTTIHDIIDNSNMTNFRFWILDFVSLEGSGMPKCSASVMLDLEIMLNLYSLNSHLRI